MKALIADRLSNRTTNQLAALGLEVTVQTEVGARGLPAALPGVQILIVRSTEVTAAAIEAAPQLALIVRAGAGVNTIDVAAASRQGVYVANCPGMNTAAVAELALGLLIAADRRIPDATLALRSGLWRKKEFGKARGLAGRTLGLVGYGAIGQALGRAAHALGMKVLAWSRSLTPERAETDGIHHAASLAELAASSDAVSVHLALTPETRHILGTEFFAALRPESIFVNTARGELVDRAALAEATSRQRLRVALDVFENEPTGGETDFAHADLVSVVACTPHIGASTDQASDAIADEVVRIVSVFLATGRPPGVVNLQARSLATHHLVVRHWNRVGVLAAVLDALRAEGVNVEEVENSVFAGGQAACCTLQLDTPPSAKLLEQLRGDPHILHAMLQAHDKS